MLSLLFLSWAMARGGTGKKASVFSRLIFFDHGYPRASLDRQGNENF